MLFKVNIMSIFFNDLAFKRKASMLLDYILSVSTTKLETTFLSIMTARKVFVFALCFLPVFLGSYWNSLPFPLVAEASDSGQLPDWVESIRKKEKDNKSENFSFNKRFCDDGIGRSMWSLKGEYGLTSRIRPRINIIGEETQSFDNPFSKSNELFFALEDQQLLIFDIKQESNNFSLGFQFRYVGKEVEDPKEYKGTRNLNTELESDQQGIEIWGEKQIGPFKLKAFSSRFWDNVDHDKDRYRMQTTKHGIGFDYKVPVLPFYFFGSYSQGITESTLEPNGNKSKGNNKQAFKGSLYYYAGNVFEVTASLDYFSIEDRVQSDKVTEVLWYEMSTNIRPLWNITITPTLSYGETKYLWYGERTENPSASLSVSCSRLFNAVDLLLWGEYSRTKGTDGYLDETTYSASAVASWEGDYFFLPKLKFSLELGYSAFIDKIYADSSYEGISASFKLRTPF